MASSNSLGGVCGDEYGQVKNASMVEDSPNIAVMVAKSGVVDEVGLVSVTEVKVVVVP
jgi:hypothetical protein